MGRVAFVSTLASLMVAASAWAVEPPVYLPSGGVAVSGYDPVAYFVEGKPVAGDPDFTYDWQGATWRFASQARRDQFKADPARYAPQFGGYCAWAVSQGYTASADPQAWRIVDGKLYLNYNLDVRKTWEQDIPGNIAKGEANWPTVLGR